MTFSRKKSCCQPTSTIYIDNMKKLTLSQKTDSHRRRLCTHLTPTINRLTADAIMTFSRKKFMLPFDSNSKKVSRFPPLCGTQALRSDRN